MPATKIHAHVEHLAPTRFRRVGPALPDGIAAAANRDCAAHITLRRNRAVIAA